MQKWSSYIKGDPKRQEVLEEALEWVSSAQGISVDAYLAQHRGDTDIAGLKTYFTSVIDWIGSVFTRPPDKEMRGLDWGRLYETYHSKSYNAAEHRRRRRAPSAATQRCGTTRASTSTCWVARRTRSCSRSGCSTRRPRAPPTSSRRRRPRRTASPTARCARSATTPTRRASTSADEMDADHVTAWSKGGDTALENCEMLCITHNRAKGNR